MGILYEIFQSMQERNENQADPLDNGETTESKSSIHSEALIESLLEAQYKLLPKEPIEKIK